MNLIRDPWIPVTNESGLEFLIAPWQITGSDEAIPVSIQGPRTDFNGIYAQFLIGLIQTACPPSGKMAWMKGFRDIPSGDMLKEAFQPFEPFFDLFNESTPFMQDVSVETKDSVPIGRLLLEMPGENAEKNNTDHFLKRDAISCMCPACAAAAMYSLQTNASFGGAGHRVGLRGGGPLTTLVKGRTLWELVWLNVMSSDKFDSLGNPEKNTYQDFFSWAGKDKELRAGRTCTPLDVHPSHMFWATPRRILLKSESGKEECDVCGVESPIIIREYWTEKNGIVYSGGWIHPLSPHYRDKKTGNVSPEHMQPGGVTYHDWLGLVQNNPERGTEPAAVVVRFRNIGPSSLKEVFGKHTVPLWSFGYDMDKAKARCYYEGFMPIPLIEEENREMYDHLVSRCLLTGDQVLFTLRMALKQAWYKEPKNAPSGDMSSIDIGFWQDTESSFYQVLGDAWRSPLSSLYCDNLKEQWLKLLQQSALRIFDELSQYEMIDVSDPQRITKARKYLRMASSKGNKTIQKMLMFSGIAEENNVSDSVLSGM